MRLLVVEDELELLRVMARALREQGYAVDEAANGQDGLFKATQWDYDAIVLDIMLPIVDGWQLLEELRKTKATPVLVLTARDAIDDRVRGLDTGADDYLIKPFDLSELFARLRALLRRSVGQTTTSIVVDDIEIDVRSRIVRRAGEVILLTAREYALVS